MSKQRLSERMREPWPPLDLKGGGYIEGEDDRVHSWADEVAALEARIKVMGIALEALTMRSGVTGQWCFRTGNGIAMGMSRKQERLTAAAQQEQDDG